MAENKREIVYYKGREYYREYKGNYTSTLTEVSNSSVTMIAFNSRILTKEEYEKERDSRPPGYINYTE